MASVTGIRSSASVLKHWREAATLIIVSPTASQKQSKLSFALTSNENTNYQHEFRDGSFPKLEEISQNYDVLMLKRSRKSKFMPDLFVYPGGVAVDNDFSSDWLTIFGRLGKNVQQQLFDKLTIGSAVSAPMFQRQREAHFSHIPPEVAFRLCAIRETFEESGVLIASPLNQLKDLSSGLSADWTYGPSSGPCNGQLMKRWRERVNEDPNEFMTMCQELDIIPAVWTLHEWSNWLTPVAAAQHGRRFDTIFYICCLDHKPEAFQDASETVDAKWSSPSTLLSAFLKGRTALAPPQVFELSRMLNFQSYFDLMKYVVQREPQRVEQWLPVTLMCKDYLVSLMPGDELYPKDPKVSQTVPFLESDKSFKEICREHPRCNRNFRFRNEMKNSKEVYHVLCNVDIGRGQVAPVTGLGGRFDFESKL